MAANHVQVTTRGKGQQAMSTTAPAASSAANQSNGAGQVSDLLGGFAAQAVKLPAIPVSDANVASAYALGWSVGDALTWCQRGTSEHLTVIADIPDGAARWNLLIDQIAFQCGQLHAHLANNPTPLDLSLMLTACGDLRLDPKTTSADTVNAAVNKKSDAVKDLNTGVVEILWATERELAKAYALGREMQDMCAGPIASGRTLTVRNSVASHADNIHKLLITLASKLPPNAAHASDNSLRLWAASLRAGGEEDAKALLHQGWRWRAVLSGEVAGKDGLRLSDYIGAADSVSQQLRQIAVQAARRFRWLLGLAALVALIGVALIVLDTKGSVGAGITAVLAAFGLTWKGIGEFFGRVAAKGEEQLWAAERDWAIAYRFTALSNPPKGAQLSRRSKFMSDDRPMKAHLVRYNEWKAEWPDVDVTPDTVRSNAAGMPATR